MNGLSWPRSGARWKKNSFPAESTRVAFERPFEIMTHQWCCCELARSKRWHIYVFVRRKTSIRLGNFIATPRENDMAEWRTIPTRCATFGLESVLRGTIHNIYDGRIVKSMTKHDDVRGHRTTLCRTILPLTRCELLRRGPNKCIWCRIIRVSLETATLANRMTKQ